MNGILVVDKPKGMTSRDVVNRVGRILNTKKIGHTGTLDPLATGVLVLCVGSATKLVELLTSHTKEYYATMMLGRQTDTLDSTGNILKEENVFFSEEQIDSAFVSMVGSYLQEVPAYSAVKIHGKKLYEYAREGEVVALPSRFVTIFSLKRASSIDYDDGKVCFSCLIHVSKGTYIRSFIRDFAFSLGTVGIMTDLRRTKQGDFSIDQACSLEDLENGHYSFYTIEEFLKSYPTVICDTFLEKKVRNGQILDNSYGFDWIVFKDKEGMVLALYYVYDQDPTKIKPYRMF